MFLSSKSVKKNQISNQGTFIAGEYKLPWSLCIIPESNHQVITTYNYIKEATVYKSNYQVIPVQFILLKQFLEYMGN